MAALALGAALAAGCAAPAPPRTAGPRVVATFSTLTSLVAAVGGSRVSVTTFVPVGASPEDFQPAPRDVAKLAAADLLVENGAGIETWLDRTIADARKPGLHRLVLTDGLPLRGKNPHLWMDPAFARIYVSRIAYALSALDPAGAPIYRANARAFNVRLELLQRSIARRIATIPPEHRTMIVFHNAWQYYDDRFGLRTVGVIELSPGQDPSPGYVANLVRLARTEHVRALFAEPEYSPKLVHALAQSAGISTVENLYDDSIGTSPEVHDYPSLLDYDTRTIVRALR